jgi:hypothetical protein
MNIQEAIEETEDKYFGDYKLTENQMQAVEILVEHAKESDEDDLLLERCGMCTLQGYRFFLPRCMGGAAHGIDGCVCSTITQQIK